MIFALRLLAVASPSHLDTVRIDACSAPASTSIASSSFFSSSFDHGVAFFSFLQRR